MKLTIYLAIELVFTLPVFLAAQDTSEPKIHRNEIGTDVTSLINQILFVNTVDDYQEYEPIYYITYKRMLKKINLRFGIGGNSKSTYRPLDRLPDKIDATSDTEIDYRLGIEKADELTKRWSFYYGLDFRHTIFKSHEDYYGTSVGWDYGNDSHGRVFAIAPIMMIEFKFNNRLSLQTQANFAAYFQHTEKTPFFYQNPADPPSEPQPPVETKVFKERGFEFSLPRFIVIAVNI